MVSLVRLASVRLDKSRNTLFRSAHGLVVEWDGAIMNEENKNEMILRKLLWLHHGCPFRALYGDDGEMQCSWCQIDFKRLPAEAIERRFKEIGVNTLQELEQQHYEHETKK